MTLVMVLGNRDQVIQLADRRLTAAGQVVDEDANKSGTVFFDDGRFTFGFSGIARALDVDVSRWLLDALRESGPPDYMAGTSLYRLREIATRDFRRLACFRSLNRESRPLSIIFAGYLNYFEPPMIASALISNSQDFARGLRTSQPWDEFVFSHTKEKEPRQSNASYIQRIGAIGAVTPTDAEELRVLLDERKPAKAIINKAIDRFQEFADRAAARGGVGKQITWIRIPSDRTEEVEFGYYSNVPSYASFSPSVVWCTSRGGGAVDGVSIVAVDPLSTPPLVVPRAPRNAPCPCGSGKKYKKCHGSPRWAEIPSVVKP
jgi:hypothetical protein